MATTDARAGFRLPWNSDRPSTDSSDGDSPDHPAAASGWPAEDGPSPAVASATGVPAAADPLIGRMPSDSEAEPATPAARPPSGKKPSRFMADLTKAMQAAAEDARSRAISQLQADAKSHVETIHGRSATEAAGLRRNADDDVAAVREWSKAEIARIREETETKITDRKARLEIEIERHAAVIEREIDSVQKTVAAFEADMASFFERLLGEEDPSRFATMAENLPEPPSFDDSTPAHATDELAPAVAVTSPDEAATGDEPMINAATGPEIGAEDAGDPRFAALGLSPDFGAAEAEAFIDAGASNEDIPEIGDDAFAARIAGLAPDTTTARQTADNTQVVVVGLVSVASIAGFKRQLARLAGVRSVGVSSGPEGEFVFTVSHEADVVLRDAIPSLPSFQARVTESSDGSVHVTAHDPESDAQAGSAD